MWLSKSKVMLGLQCHRRLWWTVHDRDAPELKPDASLQAVFDRGSRVGDVARQLVPGGELVDMDALGGPKGAIERTRALLGTEVPAIFEASFRANDVFAAIDILEREEDGWVLGEVKSTLSVKDQHVRDAAVQTWVARSAGVNVRRVEVIHLNAEHRHPDHEPLFVRIDVTERVEEFLEALPAEVDAQQAMLDEVMPQVDPGERCDTPYECPFKRRCLPRPPRHHISGLYAISRATLAEFEAANISRIYEIPQDHPLTPVRRRQWQAIKRRRRIVEPSLAEALRTIGGPVAYLDFETIALALPAWDGTRPYQTIPVQFSAHSETAGEVKHVAWLAEGDADPREALAEALLQATEGAASVLAYNSRFEERCIRELAEAVPARADQLHALADRLVDMLPLVRDHVYDVGFGASFSLKAVAPVLLGKDYADLEIGDGMLASNKLEQLLLAPETLDEEVTELRANLLAYCERDTAMLVELRRELERLAG